MNATHDHHDNWHHHEASEGAPQEEHGSVAKPAALARGLVLIIVTTLALVGVTLLYFNHTFQQLRKLRANSDLSQKYWEYREASKTRLEAPGKDGKPALQAAKEAVTARYQAVK